MKKISIKGKNIGIVNSHNQVLEAWESGPKRNVFSLDFHTDTRRAFHKYARGRAGSEYKTGLCHDIESRKKELVDQKIKGYLENRITLSQINDNLRHDEHLDFAIRTNIINRAFILAKNRNENSSNPHVFLAHGSEEYHGQRIIEFSPVCQPDSSIKDSLIDNAVHHVLSCDKAFLDHFIFDIDCDYFNTEKSLTPDSCETFKTLISRAELITIALEPVCVKICRQKGSLLDSDAILDRLISLVEESQVL